ncbi:hypothetical protein ACFL58_00560 [Elusimicrobiota bacterium]
MHKLRNYFIIFSLLFLPVFFGCSDNPQSNLVSPQVFPGNTAWGDWVLYDDELKNNGDFIFLRSQEGQTINVSVFDKPGVGFKCMMYSWDGSEVTDYTTNTREFDWVGFRLAVQDSNDPNSPANKDITPGAYTKISFMIRGELYDDVVAKLKFEATPSITNTWTSNVGDHVITDDWVRYEFPISGASASNIQDYLIVVYEYSGAEQGHGGTIFLDDIKLTK